MKIDDLFDEIEKEIRSNHPNLNIYVPRPDPKNGKEKIDILFVNERPGRIGTTKSGYVSFDNDDPTAKQFKELFKLLKISREKIFITNACLWIPHDSDYRDTPPSISELKEGDVWFKEQLTLLEPKLIIAVGKSALRALKVIFPDSKQLKKYTLKKDIGELIRDTNPLIYPVYHTAARVRNSGLRTKLQQQDDWLKINEILSSFPKPL